MPRIRCDNAECVVYVDELTRTFPQDVSLEVSPRPLVVGLADAEQVARRRAGRSAPDAPGGHGVRGSDIGVAARQGAARSAGRLPARSPSASAIHAFVLQVARAREASLMLVRGARCDLARQVQALVEPGRHRPGPGFDPKR